MGNDPEAWRRFMEARAAKDAALKAKKEKQKPAKERKPMEERPVVREPSGPPPDYLTGPTRKGKRRFASSGWLTWICRRFEGSWQALVNNDANDPYCLVCQKRAAEST